MQQIKIRKDGSIDVQTINNEPSLTQQQFKDQCDINHIIARYQKTGEIQFKNADKGVYADLTKLPTSYQDALEIVQKADDAFMSLDANVRARFENDPKQMIEFLSDSKNKDEAIKLGLVNPPPADPIPVVDPKSKPSDPPK